MGTLLLPAFLLVGLLQLAAGFMGLEYLLGLWAAIAGLAMAFLLRIMLPLTIGSYFGVVEVMGLPWWVGILVAAPGVLFLLPSGTAAISGGRRM